MEFTVDISKRSNLLIDWRQVWGYRNLLFTFSQRDIKVRYAQTSLGFLWAIFQPLITLIILILIFNKAIKINTGSTPYPIFTLSGLLAWTYFAFMINQVSNAITSNIQLVNKIYFPRIILLLSKSFVGLVDFFIVFGFLLLYIIFTGFPISKNIIFFPLLFFSLFFISFTLSIFLSAISIRFRDLQILIPFLVQIGLYATPVAYPAKIFPAEYLWIYSLNPMVTITEGFRWCFVGGEFNLMSLFYLLLCFIPLFFLVQVFFRATEDTLSELL
ncbi:MAG: ABC transporter permease [Chloroherpetonaceae bacterium]|nr:ABC transporter permease [Chloroherpetonaceae bacterium]